MSRFLATVVIPAYNEERRLPPLLGELVRLGLDHGARPVEIVVVDDGSAAGHLSCHRKCVAAAAEQLARAGSCHRVRLVESGANQGKGGAIRLGWREADPASTWLAFLDADGAVPASEFWRLLGLLGEDADVLAGSRILMAGRRIRRSTFRHLQGRVFASLTEWSLHLGFYDTQCGIKFVRASALRPHLGMLRERGWLLDIEILGLVRLQGGRLREEPIDWADPGGSKVKFGIDALRMLVGLRRIKRALERRAAAGEISPLDRARGAVHEHEPVLGRPSGSTGDQEVADASSRSPNRACVR